MTSLLFGQSYYLKFDPKLWEAMQPYPPLGTLYAASFLRAHGYSGCSAPCSPIRAGWARRWPRASAMPFCTKITSTSSRIACCAARGSLYDDRHGPPANLYRRRRRLRRHRPRRAISGPGADYVLLGEGLTCWSCWTSKLCAFDRPCSGPRLPGQPGAGRAYGPPPRHPRSGRAFRLGSIDVRYRQIWRERRHILHE